MITKNKAMKKILTRGLLIILTITPFFTMAQDKVIDQIVAVVGGNIILKSDIENMYMQNQASGITSDGDMKCEILEQLLIEKLLLAEAELDTLIEVTPSQINQQLDAQIQQYLSYFETQEALEEYFKKPLPLIKADMQDMIKNRLLTQQMNSKIVENVKATPSEVRAFYRQMEQDKIPRIPTQYEYAQITIYPKVEQNEENRIKAKLREYKKRIEDGTNFATLAVMYSEGHSARDGGDIGYSGRAQLDPTYAAAAFNLKGDRISNVVKSEFGYHIIQLIDRKGEKVRTRHILMQPRPTPKAMEEASKALDTLSNAIRKGDISFDEAAARYSFDKDSRNNGGIVINPNTRSSRFSIEQLPPDVSKIITGLHVNEISEPFKSIDQNSRQNVYKIIKLVNKVNEHKANIQEDYQLVSNVYLESKREKMLQDWITKQQADNYIHIDDTYSNCNFEYRNWIK